ncbi:MAG: hypothetical protein V3U98_07080, partial [Acidobacteriota bacterium]
MAKISLTIVVIALILISGAFFSQQPSAQVNLRGGMITFDVVPNFDTFRFVDLDESGTPTAGEPFDVEGTIFEEGAIDRGMLNTEPPVGTFLCRGFFIIPQDDGDFTFVHQSYEIDGLGTIHVEGNEPGAV